MLALLGGFETRPYGACGRPLDRLGVTRKRRESEGQGSRVRGRGARRGGEMVEALMPTE